MKKRFLKLISLVLATLISINMFNGLETFATSGKAEYYVAPNGTGDGKTVTTPAGSISVVMQTIINAGYDEGDNVTIYVAGGEGASVVPSTGLVVNQSWPWPNEFTKANIIITSMPNAKAPAILASTTDAPLVIFGNTTFKNITLYDQSGEERIHTNGFSVTFDEDVTFKKGASVLTDYSPKIYIGSGYSWGVRYDYEGTLTVNNTSNNKNYSIVFGGYTWNGEGENAANYLNGDKKVIINGGTVDNLYLLGFKRNCAYQSNLSVVLNDAKLKKASTSLIEGYAPEINGSIQIVANGTELPDMTSIVSYAKEKNVPYYFVSSYDSGSIMLTDKTGEFSFNSDFGYTYVYDTDCLFYSDNILKINKSGSYKVEYANSIDEIIKTVGGEWADNGDGTMSRISATAEYYVQYGGTGDGLSPETPLSTVDDAVKAANAAGLTYGDTVYINVMQSKDWNWGAGTIGAGDNYRSDAHHITTWASQGALTAHTAKIVVQGYGEGVVYLASNAKLGFNLDMIMGGPTEFNNITIVRMRRWRGIFANGYDVKYGENSRVAIVNVDDCDSTFKAWDGNVYFDDENTFVSLGNVKKLSDGKGGTIELDNFNVQKSVVNIAFSSSDDIWVNGSATGPTSDIERYANDVRIIYSNPRLIANIYWGNVSGGSSLFENNINLNIKMVNEMNYIKGLGTVTVNGGVQIISKQNISAITEIPDNVTINGGKWVLFNNGVDDLIDFTEHAGTFTVKNGCGVVATNVETNEEFISSKSLLMLPQGNYIIAEIDINDSVYDANDLINLKKFLLGVKDSVGSFADYHYDGKLNILDIVALKKHIAGILPIDGGFAEDYASELRNKILNSSNTEENYTITGTKYYVSENGSSLASGKYKIMPTTISKIRDTSLKAGDAVLFERGSVFRVEESFQVKSGVVYGSYGDGDKPKFYASPKSLVGSAVWTSTENENIWKTDFAYEEVGNVVFNHGEISGYKKYTKKELNNDFDFYHDMDNNVLYIKYSGGNPGNDFESIEACCSTFIISMPNNIKNVVIDNLCLKYSGYGAIYSYILSNVSITNCEIGWIGGTTYKYNENVRMGNAIGNWGGVDGWFIKNNWIYQTFDSAVSPQGQLDPEGESKYENIEISDNLFEYNNADIEYWCDTPHTLKNFKIDKNIFRFTSLGWGSRIDDGGIRGIEGVVVMTSKDFVDPANISFKNNIIDCPGREIIRWDYNPGFETALSMTGNEIFIKQSYRATDKVISNKMQKSLYASDLNTLKSVFSIFPDFGDMYWYEYR